MYFKDITDSIISAAMKVHTTLGPGLLENVYETCLVHELKKQDIEVKHQVVLPVIYDNIQMDLGYRLDLLVEDKVIIELKSVEKLLPIHEAQLLSYLKLGKKKVGLLINFNVVQLKTGIKRLVN
jgi:GxxExxY protein